MRNRHALPVQQRGQHSFSEASVICADGRRMINTIYAGRSWKNYKSHQNMVFRINSVPRTPDRPAEHFLAVVFGRSNFIEAAFGL
jgi:hypothetical protein